MKEDGLKKLEKRAQELFKDPLKISMTQNFASKGDHLYSYINETVLPNVIRRLDASCADVQDCALLGSMFKELILDVDHSLTDTKFEVLPEIKSLKVTFSNYGYSYYEQTNWSRILSHDRPRYRTGAGKGNWKI